MPQIINTNIASLNAQRNLNNSQAAGQTAMQRLSSGLRINSAKDDAAGLAISERFTSQITGLNQAMRNANDGISLAQTAEGALGQAGDILQRIRELAVQSANDTNSAQDRKFLQAEIVQLKNELNRIADTTNFNGRTLLDGSFTGAQFQVGANANQTIDFTLGNARATAIGNYQVNAGGSNLSKVVGGTTAGNVPANGVEAANLTVSGMGASEVAQIEENASAFSIAEAINAHTAKTGVTASATTTATLSDLEDGTVSFTLGGDTTAKISATISNDGDLSELAAAINDTSAITGVTAKVKDNGSIELHHAEGKDITIADFDTTANANTATFSVGASSFTLEEGANNSAVAIGTVEFSSSSGFSIQSDNTNDNILVDTVIGGKLNSVAQIDITTAEGANSAIEVVDAALQSINRMRSDLGAIQNRFQNTIANLSTTSENLSAARSRIQDADFAAESAELARTQVLQQAGLSVLAQANAKPRDVLQLLQN